MKPSWERFERRKASVVRARVTWCAFTRKWIVNVQGRPHVCGRTSFKSDLAFRHWHDTMDEANRLYRDRLSRVLAEHFLDEEDRGLTPPDQGV